MVISVVKHFELNVDGQHDLRKNGVADCDVVQQRSVYPGHYLHALLHKRRHDVDFIGLFEIKFVYFFSGPTSWSRPYFIRTMFCLGNGNASIRNGHSQGHEQRKSTDEKCNSE